MARPRHPLLRDRGITVVSLTENFDLGTKEGRFMFAAPAAARDVGKAQLFALSTAIISA